MDNPSVSAIREAREEAGVIGNEKRERRQKLMSEGGGEGSPSLLVRCQTQHTEQLKEREREGGGVWYSYQILAPAGIAILWSGQLGRFLGVFENTEKEHRTRVFVM